MTPAWPPSVASLLAAGRVEPVPADLDTALRRLARAEEKLAVARGLASVDVEVSYVTAYDAARVAFTAHMLAAGLRVPARPRAHETVGSYAEATIAVPSAREFQRMRRRRNKAEYDDVVLGAADLATDLAHAAALVAAVRADLTPPSST